MREKESIPECYGEFICPDDCMVSCPYWEDCMEERDRDENGTDDDYLEDD